MTAAANKAAAAKRKPRSMFRRPLSGELASRLYRMPPLPPTTTSLTAFKCLLLDRLQLLRVAGKFHVDSVLRVPKELKQELNQSALSLTPASETVTGTTQRRWPTASTQATATPRKKHCRSRAERMLSFSYPQVIRSEWHAQHWMKVIRNTHDYQMLRSRLLSVFLWPALLSSVRVEDRGTASTVATLLGCGRLTVESLDEDEERRETGGMTTASSVPAPRPLYRSVHSRSHSCLPALHRASHGPSTHGGQH